MSTGNYFRTALLLGLLTGLIVACGALVGGKTGAIVALGFAAVTNFASYWYSDRIVLRMHRARQVGPQEAPHLCGMVERLAGRAGLPTPRVFVLPETAPNAFATGRNPENSAVAVTQGLLEAMDAEELEGVIAHELAHIGNRDILISSIAATIAGAISMLATFAQWSAIFGGFGGQRDERGGGNLLGLLVMIFVAPLAAGVIQMAVSRSREYAADATGAKIAGSPHGLARALRKLGALSKRVPMRHGSATASSHLFIVMPLSMGSARNWFSTHPPIEERIRRLVGTTAV